MANTSTPGLARWLTDNGYRAIGTSSLGLAMDLGVEDHGVDAEQVLRNAGAVAVATPLPVSADLENGFGETTTAVGRVFREAAARGLSGGSIEDGSGDPDHPVLQLSIAVARLAAAVAAARAADGGFLVTARAENLDVRRSDLADTVRRRQAFEAAGADALFAQGLSRDEDNREVLSAVTAPLNVVVSDCTPARLGELAALGVRRISLGPLLPRAANAAAVDSARRLLDAL